MTNEPETGEALFELRSPDGHVRHVQVDAAASSLEAVQASLMERLAPEHWRNLLLKVGRELHGFQDPGTWERQKPMIVGEDRNVLLLRIENPLIGDGMVRPKWTVWDEWRETLRELLAAMDREDWPHEGAFLGCRGTLATVRSVSLHEEGDAQRELGTVHLLDPLGAAAASTPPLIAAPSS